MNKILPYYLQEKFSFAFDIISLIENFIIKRKNIKIKKPIYVSGLARSGTTVITHLLDEYSDVGSFKYKDLPFYTIPYFWNKINFLYFIKNLKKERIHKDGILVSPESPDSFEELIWRKNIKNYNENGFCKILDSNNVNVKLIDDLKNNIRKVLHIRNKNRYLAKGNYNLFRFKFIIDLFPDCKIILCVRDPVLTAFSLERLHNQFMQYSYLDKNFSKELLYLGHFEFGINRKPINLNKVNTEKSIDSWKKNNSFLGYLYQWIDVYNFIKINYLDNPTLSKNFIVVDNDDLKNNFYPEVQRIFDFCDLGAIKNIEKLNYNITKHKLREFNINEIKVVNEAKNLFKLYKENYFK